MPIPTTPSPVGQHILTTIFLLVLWPILASTNSRKKVPDEEWKKYRSQVFLIMIATAATFCFMLLLAFETGDIAGYEVSADAHMWMDNINAYEAVYDGEWTAYYFLYLFPLAAAAANAMLLKQPYRKYFRKAFFRLYVPIILVSYISLWLITTVSGNDLKRKQLHEDQDTHARSFYNNDL